MKKSFDIIIVGAGGTGTYFLKEFSRFIAGSPYEKRICHIYLFDGDTVEKKNLSRQCFLKEDIGRNKAAVMAEVLNEAFDLTYTAYGSYLTKKEQLKKLYLQYDTIPVIVSCVDNHACRLLLEEYFSERRDCVLFDSANEYENGEVVYAYRLGGKTIGPVRSVYFPGIKKEDLRNREELSCEELNQVSPQHIFTNMQAANLLLAGIANLMDGKITPGFAYFNTLQYQSGFVPWKDGGDNA